MPGSLSGEESALVLRVARRLILYLGLDRYERVQLLLADPQLMHHYVRKLAHFSEYLVLGVLALQALRVTLSHPVLFVSALALMWLGVPGFDELVIQRMVPERSGDPRDMLIDMAGFALGFALSGLVALVGSLFDDD
jgi:VanZ family protein